MAKACAYLCRQCCFIDGFDEFGEMTRSNRLLAQEAHISCFRLSLI